MAENKKEMERAELHRTIWAIASGYLECDGRIVKVYSLDAVKRFIAEVEATADNSDE